MGGTPVKYSSSRYPRYGDRMPRQARLDAPGVLHHIMARGIERRRLFLTDRDRDDFLERLGALAKKGALVVYAWALVENHFHLLVRTGRRPLSASMRSLLTGYAVAFNKRNRRSGHVFQNRFKSVLCEEDPYFLELVRYIHLNPLRAKLVADMAGLDEHPYSGHAALMGVVNRPWQETREVLAQFGRTVVCGGWRVSPIHRRWCRPRPPSRADGRRLGSKLGRGLGLGARAIPRTGGSLF